ncbi:MAG: PD40 domain-containing protein [Anaerolineales bacterium]|uniref:TolB family protein n=1 Tax=Promineifilum sp. TaxID=2664178 RepID=UPI001D47F57D|nr:PD40 domain-containing protein [Anaerolineales bacterium]MCB8934865.1 PD40 domain-containing protein [Promineifilum sp.]MCO5182280.1 hypothetical protein [Promineifilum sp.]
MNRTQLALAGRLLAWVLSPLLLFVGPVRAQSIPPLPPRQIAYTEPAGEGSTLGHIRLVNADGSSGQQITSGDADCCAAWSSDGRRLYFLRYPSGEPANDAPPDIMEYDFDDGRERVIRPGDGPLGASLAASPDDRYLAFVTNSPMPRQSPDDIFLIDNRACLNLFELAGGQTVEIYCVEQGGLSDLEFYPAEPSLAAVMGGFESSIVVVFDLLPSSPSPFTMVCCFSPQMAGNDVRVYAVGNNYYMFNDFQANGWEGWGIFEYGQGLHGPIPVLISDTPIDHLDLSPEESHLVFDRAGQIELIYIWDPDERAIPITSGLQPVWRPGEAMAAAPATDTPAATEAATPITPAITAASSVTHAPTAEMPLPNQADDAAANEEIVATRVAERPATGDATPPVAPIVVGSGRSRGLLMGIIVVAAAIALFSLLAYFTHRD